MFQPQLLYYFDRPHRILKRPRLSRLAFRLSSNFPVVVVHTVFSQIALAIHRSRRQQPLLLCHRRSSDSQASASIMFHPLHNTAATGFIYAYRHSVSRSQSSCTGRHLNPSWHRHTFIQPRDKCRTFPLNRRLSSKTYLAFHTQGQGDENGSSFTNSWKTLTKLRKSVPEIDKLKVDSPPAPIRRVHPSFIAA